MDSSTLRRLANEGLAAAPGDELTDLAIWCRDYCEASGDGRYCSLGETLRSLDDWRQQHDERGGVPAGLLRDIERVIKAWLLAILDAEDPAEGSQLARTLRQEVQSLLLDPAEWAARGYTDP